MMSNGNLWMMDIIIDTYYLIQLIMHRLQSYWLLMKTLKQHMILSTNQ